MSGCDVVLGRVVVDGYVVAGGCAGCAGSAGVVVVGAVVVAGVVGAVVVAGVVGAVAVAGGCCAVVSGCAAALASMRDSLLFFKSLTSVDSVSIDITDSPEVRAICIAWLFGYTSSLPERSPA